MKMFLKRYCLLGATVSLLLSSYNSNAQTATAPSGTGTSGDPYLVATLDNLYWITQNSAEWGKYYKQTANIDASSTNTWASGAGWSPIGNGSTQFTGAYDGDNYTISNIYINRGGTDYIGFFGYANVSDNAKLIQNIRLSGGSITGSTYCGALIGYMNNTCVKNCHSSVNVTGTGNFTGGLIGRMGANSTYGYVMDCSATGTVNSSSAYAGGLVGYNQAGSGPGITGSFATGNVTNSSSRAGGLVGVNQGIISQCYAKGNASASDYAGGLIGWQLSGAITNCYSTGSVTSPGSNKGGFTGTIGGTLSNNFWDTQTSGQATSPGSGAGALTGQTTAQMTTQSTFTTAGWDFQGETTNGTNDYWSINSSSNGGYPFLVSNTFGVLPLTWGSFTVQKQGTGVLLKWSTASESNTKDFIIEHSANGSNWSAIGTLAAAGNSTTDQSYQYIHNNPLNGINYYRLKQRDIDERSSNSKTVNILFVAAASGLNVYPNPVTNGQINVELAQPAIVNIYDNQGKLLLSRQLSAGLNRVDISHLTKGIYRVRVGEELITIMNQ